jgi:hypothetical protein
VHHTWIITSFEEDWSLNMISLQHSRTLFDCPAGTMPIRILFEMYKFIDIIISVEFYLGHDQENAALGRAARSSGNLNAECVNKMTVVFQRVSGMPSQHLGPARIRIVQCQNDVLSSGQRRMSQAAALHAFRLLRSTCSL